MSYYDNQKSFQERGIDYDFVAAYNNGCMSATFDLNDVQQVLAVWEGDEDEWRWIVRLNDDKQIFIKASSCNTGWDCSCSGTTTDITDFDDISKLEDSHHVREVLRYQYVFGRYSTWREKIDKEISNQLYQALVLNVQKTGGEDSYGTLIVDIDKGTVTEPVSKRELIKWGKVEATKIVWAAAQHWLDVKPDAPNQEYIEMELLNIRERFEKRLEELGAE